MLSPFAVILIPQSREKNLALPLRVNSAKHLALLFVGGKVQGEPPRRVRSAPLRSE
jgi:hypothetical protein